MDRSKFYGVNRDFLSIEGEIILLEDNRGIFAFSSSPRGYRGNRGIAIRAALATNIRPLNVFPILIFNFLKVRKY